MNSFVLCHRFSYLNDLLILNSDLLLEENPGLDRSSLSRTTELNLSSSLRPSSFSKETRRRYCKLLSISLANRAARASR